MGIKKSALGGALLLLVAFCVPTASGQLQESDQARVLFIGNSYTRFNDMPRMVSQISRSVPGGVRIRPSRVAHGGYSLRQHWVQREAQTEIRSGHFDQVVLQERSTRVLEDPSQTDEFARRFVELVRESGARPVFFQTWARHPDARLFRRRDDLDDPQQMRLRVASFWGRLGRRTDTAIAPVGFAWMRANRELPQMEIYRPDHTHPAVPGSYLSALVLYGTLTGNDPRRAQWEPWPVRPAEGQALRQVAAETLGRFGQASLRGQSSERLALRP